MLTAAQATIGRGLPRAGGSWGGEAREQALLVIPVSDKWTQPQQRGPEGKQDISFWLLKQTFFCLNQEPRG